MFYIADLHLHSHYSRATSKDLNLETLYQWARIKGIHVVGTGDFTHPLWFNELKAKLEPDGTGLFRLKNPPKADVPGFKCHDIDVRFCLTSEISSIYKHGDRVRKNHNCVYAPDLDTVARLNARLSQIGNLASDGRPILGLPSHDLLEIVLETHEHAHLIPAHIWTPWFSMFGSKSGYDSVQECFRDLSGHIFALETGLSSDPEMNWRLSMLDGYTLVSNSDAHSPQKLGREANLFQTERSYYALFDALKTKQGFLGTYEFFPEEGKYHMDGHRKCEVCLEPEESRRYHNLCPKCGQPLTIGVLHRVTELADRTQPQRPTGAADFHYIIPLPEIIAEVREASPISKAVGHAFQQVISAFGNEFTLLHETPIEDIEKRAGNVLAEAIRRMRTHEVNPQGGYDGEYGTIKIFKDGEIGRLTGQLNFFGVAAGDRLTKRKPNTPILTKPQDVQPTTKAGGGSTLNAEQLAACEAEGTVLVTAGPGTGKTKTLISWVAYRIQQLQAQPPTVMAVTFTNKAADEVKARLMAELGERANGVVLGTFHSLCFSILQEYDANLVNVYDAESRRIILGMLFPEADEKTLKKWTAQLEDYFEANGTATTDEIRHIAAVYRQFVARNGSVDVSDIIGSVVRLWKAEPERLESYRKRIQYIAVDELQDINPMQYEFLVLLGSGKQVFAIGDPDQSIYGFRGADVGLFFRFGVDFQATEIVLRHHYRATDILVKAASHVIRNNTLRKDTDLVAFRQGGMRINMFMATDEQEEAAFVVGEIEKLVGGFSNLTGNTPQHSDSKYGFSDIAVLFRTRTIGKALLPAFQRAGIPVRYGDATPFLATYPFHLITDAIKLYLNPQDAIALDSLLTHGFGMDKSRKQAFFATHAEERRFVALFGSAATEHFATQGAEGAVGFVLERLITDSLLDETGIFRKETVLSLAKEYGPDLGQFLRKALVDSYTDVARFKTDAVNLLTFHAAKGLEFPVVFVVGAEEGVTPLLRGDVAVEEERRLYYVALTRAKDRLYISHAAQRQVFDKTLDRVVSRFTGEIPTNLVEHIRKKQPQAKQMRLF